MLGRAPALLAPPVSATSSRGSPARGSAARGRFEIGGGAGAGTAGLLLLGFDPHRETAVHRGENAGRTIVQSAPSSGSRTGTGARSHPCDLALARGWHLTFAWAFAAAIVTYAFRSLANGHLRRDLAELRAKSARSQITRHDCEIPLYSASSFRR